jgi:phosphatidylethanolamine/phosphatidyl-N-methylethanolamine N-methyltransferase
VFIKRLLTKPRRVSAISPSSRALGRAMALGLGHQSGPVVEFGPGTGRLTAAILATGVRPQDLTCLELDAEFTALIRRRFPGVTVFNAGAERAALHVKTPVARVISGLPLLSMPKPVRMGIVKAAFDILAPGGQMVQFTYGRGAPLSVDELDQLGLRAEKGERVLLNLPPARVYRFHRKSE